MSRFRRLRIVASASIAATTLLLPVSPAASSAPHKAAEDLVFAGVCPMPEPFSKDVVIVARLKNLWGQYRLLDANLRDTRLKLFPYQVTFSGLGLKTRHITPDVPYTKPGKTPENPVTCDFHTDTVDGPIDVAVVGTIR